VSMVLVYQIGTFVHVDSCGFAILELPILRVALKSVHWILSQLSDSLEPGIGRNHPGLATTYSTTPKEVL
jgi:hypothetical protein